MNTKSSWVALALVLLAILFVPLIPNDVPLTGCVEPEMSCDEVGYISVYQKYFK
jgi:hypothetical protein